MLALIYQAMVAKHSYHWLLRMGTEHGGATARVERYQPDMPNNGGLAPLLLTIKKGHYNAVKLLQARIRPYP